MAEACHHTWKEIPPKEKWANPRYRCVRCGKEIRAFQRRVYGEVSSRITAAKKRGES